MKDVLNLEYVDSSLKLETLQATADFQFGPDTGASLIPPNSKITGKLYRNRPVTGHGVVRKRFFCN